MAVAPVRMAIVLWISAMAIAACGPAWGQHQPRPVATLASASGLEPETVAPASKIDVGKPAKDLSAPASRPGENAPVSAPGAQPGDSGKGPKARTSTGPERAVAVALNWLSRHQSADGSWSLDGYTKHCLGSSCAGTAKLKSDPAATAMGTLVFLAAGQNHKTRGPYRQTIERALRWLLLHQAADGDLTGQTASGGTMYTHGIGTIALCEAFGMTKDATVGRAAQSAVRFIEKAQHPNTGGWRYQPGDEGDTSVLAWQVSALRSATLAGLIVNPKTSEGARQWLKTVAVGAHGGQFCYVRGCTATPSMTAAGLLSQQLLGMKRDDPAIAEGIAVLAKHAPDNNQRNIYFWYFATQALHNAPGPEWDQWNRRLRRTLIESQCREGCAAGSWDPDKPAKDVWGEIGGRFYATSFAALSLEVYYRYLLLFKGEAVAPAQADGGK